MLWGIGWWGDVPLMEYEPTFRCRARAGLSGLFECIILILVLIPPSPFPCIFPQA